MIRVRVVFNDGVETEGTYAGYDELTAYIKENSENIKTMEVDVENCDNNRPAFWSEKR